MSEIIKNKGIFKHLQEFHSKKREKVCNSRQNRCNRLSNLRKCAQLLSSQNGVSSIIYTYTENMKGPNSVSGFAFGDKANKILASKEAIEFSIYFRKSFLQQGDQLGSKEKDCDIGDAVAATKEVGDGNCISSDIRKRVESNNKGDTAIAGTKKKSKRNDANETSNSVSRLPLESEQGNRIECDGGEPPEHPIFNTDSQDAVAARKEDDENWNSPDIRKRARSKNKRDTAIDGTKKKSKRNDKSETSNSVSRLPLESEQGNRIESDGGEPPEHPIFNTDSQDAVAARKENAENWNSPDIRKRARSKNKRDTAIDGIEKKNKRNDTMEISESSNSVSRVPLVSPQGNRIECDVGGEPPKHRIFNGDSQDAVACKEVVDLNWNSPDIRKRIGSINQGELTAENQGKTKQKWITAIDDSSNCESNRPRFVKRLKLA